jgi:hypothetical protein
MKMGGAGIHYEVIQILQKAVKKIGVVANAAHKILNDTGFPQSDH